MAGKTQSSHALELDEDEEQKSLFEWIDLMASVDSRYAAIFSVPNAGKRSFRLAQWLKGQGMKKGVPDIICLYSSSPYFGLAIELKKKKGGKVSPEQACWLKLLGDHGYKAVVCEGAADAIATITKYMGKA